MIALKKLSSTNFLSWIRDKCKLNKTNTFPLHSNACVLGESQIQPSDNITTISSQVQELTSNRNAEIPNIFIVKSCQPTRVTSGIVPDEPLPDSSRWASPSLPGSLVEGPQTQQSDNVAKLPGHDNGSIEIQLEEANLREWKPSKHLHIESTLHSSASVEGGSQIEPSDNIPTISAVVQELSIGRNGSPNLITVNSSDPNSERSESNESFPSSRRWAFPSFSEASVEDLQQNDDSAQVPGHENGSIEIQVEGANITTWKPSSHLHKYLCMMHICGTAPLASKPYLSDNRHHKSWKWLSVIQRVFFCTVVGCAAFDLACQSKFFLLCFLSGDGFNALVKFSFRLISLGTAIQFACILCRDQEMKRMMVAIRTYEENDSYERTLPNLSTVLGILTTLVAVATQIFSLGIWDDSFLETVQYYSFSMSLDIFLWDFKNITISIDKLSDQFLEPTSFNIGLGIFMMVRDFLSRLLMGMMWDLILVVNLMLSCWKHVFLANYAMPVVDIVGTGPSNSFDARTLQNTREAAFNKWRAYRNVYKLVNIVFGPFLPLFHVRNVLMYAFFLSICILPDETTTTIVYVSYLYEIVKAEITYIISSRLTEQNEVIRTLLRNWAMRTGKITVDGENWKWTTLSDELDSEPLLFGTGNFAINQKFHFGIIGLVGSLFVSLANGIGKISSVG